MNRRFFLTLLLCFFTLAGCENAGTGTIVNKPKPPSENLFPDIDAYLQTTALIGDTTSASESTNLQTSHLVIDTDTGAGVTVQQIWDAVFRDRGVENAHLILTQLRSFGATVSDQIEAAGITELTDTVQTLTSDSALTLVETNAVWETQAKIDELDSSLGRYYFINSATGLVHGTYRLLTNSEGTPLKAVFGFTNPDLHITGAGEGKRWVVFVYDVSDPTQTLFTLRVDHKIAGNDDYFAYQLHLQYNTETSEGLGKYLEIITTPPEREFSSFSVDFSWNDLTGEVCMTPLGSSTRYQFTGPDTPSDDEITQNTCTIGTPHWGSHTFTTEDLVLRYDDTTPAGGSALQYYDGSSLTGWDNLTEMDTWLDASGF